MNTRCPPSLFLSLLNCNHCKINHPKTHQTASLPLSRSSLPMAPNSLLLWCQWRRREGMLMLSSSSNNTVKKTQLQNEDNTAYRACITCTATGCKTQKMHQMSVSAEEQTALEPLRTNPEYINHSFFFHLQPQHHNNTAAGLLWDSFRGSWACLLPTSFTVWMKIKKCIHVFVIESTTAQRDHVNRMNLCQQI